MTARQLVIGSNLPNQVMNMKRSATSHSSRVQSEKGPAPLTKCEAAILNDDLWRTVLGYLDIESLLKCELTCKEWLYIVRGGTDLPQNDNNDDKTGNQRTLSCIWGTLYCRLWRRRTKDPPNSCDGWSSLLPANFATAHQLKLMCRQRYVDFNKTIRTVSTAATTTFLEMEGGGTNMIVTNNQQRPAVLWGWAVQSVRFEDELQPLACSTALGLDICYFEVHVKGGASVGIASIETEYLKGCYGRAAQNHVGWRGISFGFHSDDGKIYWHCDRERNYQYANFGAPWETDAVIGCGYNRMTSKLFFTVDGQFIGEFDRVEIPRSKYAAAISVHELGDSARINFGSVPFEFDVEMFCYNTRYETSKPSDVIDQ